MFMGLFLNRLLGTRGWEMISTYHTVHFSTTDDQKSKGLSEYQISTRSPVVKVLLTGKGQSNICSNHSIVIAGQASCNELRFLIFSSLLRLPSSCSCFNSRPCSVVSSAPKHENSPYRTSHSQTRQKDLAPLHG